MQGGVLRRIPDLPQSSPWVCRIHGLCLRNHGNLRTLKRGRCLARWRTALLLKPGSTCWRVEKTGRLGLIIDMADYFAAAKMAMQKAKRSIHLLNWAFDPETFFLPDKDGKGPPSDTFRALPARSGPSQAGAGREDPLLALRPPGGGDAELLSTPRQGVFRKHAGAVPAGRLSAHGRLPPSEGDRHRRRDGLLRRRRHRARSLGHPPSISTTILADRRPPARNTNPATRP